MTSWSASKRRSKVEFAVGLVGVVGSCWRERGRCRGNVEGRAGAQRRVDECAGALGIACLPRLRDRFFGRLYGLVGLTGRGLLQNASVAPTVAVREIRDRSAPDSLGSAANDE